MWLCMIGKDLLFGLLLQAVYVTLSQKDGGEGGDNSSRLQAARSWLYAATCLGTTMLAVSSAHLTWSWARSGWSEPDAEMPAKRVK